MKVSTQMNLRTLSIVVFAACSSIALAGPADFRIASLARGGNLIWTNAFTNGVCTIESKDAIDGTNPWRFERSTFTSSPGGQNLVSLASSNRFYRATMVDVSINTAQGFDNLTHCYGTLRTVAGSGYGGTDDVNYWQPAFEGGFATNAALSRPHNAQADANGNIFIVDKCSHAVLKVTTDGRIHTVAGTHTLGNGGDLPAYATNSALNNPNGLYITKPGNVFILDTGNGKVRRLETNGIMSTLFTVSGGITTGRGLWVDDSETKAAFCSGNAVRTWTPAGGVRTLNSNFIELGNLTVDDQGYVLATDRGDNTVWRIDASGNPIKIFGSGSGSKSDTRFIDGTAASLGTLYGVRGIWKLAGGYLLATHEGSQVIFVDSSGTGRIWLDGKSGKHGGDNQWFYASNPTYKISETRSVTVDPQGNILIVENDNGYVRQIDFRPMGK